MATELGSVGKAASDRAAEIEELGRLPDDIAAALAETGICRALAPEELGAPEMALPDLLPMIEELAYHEGGLGWCAMISSTTSLAAGFLPEGAAAEIYGPADAWTGGFAAPKGRSRPVDGGLDVSGRWAWGSGSHHCTFLGGGTLLVDESGKPTTRSDGLRAPFVFFAPEQYELLDTWHVLGMRGSGSTDYSVTAAFVPEGRWFEIGQAPTIDRALYRFPFFGALAVGVASVALGLARRAIDELTELAGGKRPAGSTRTLAERPVIQAHVAEALAAYRSGRLLLLSETTEAWRAVQDGEAPAQARLALRLAATNATVQSAAAVDRCYNAAGGSSVYDTSTIQKVFRDVHVATQHAMVAPRLNEVVGRSHFGLETRLDQI